MGLVHGDTALGSTELNGKSKWCQVEDEKVGTQKSIIGTSCSEDMRVREGTMGALPG